MWVSLFHASTSDPGYLPRNVPEYDLAIKQVSIEHRDFSSLPQGRIKRPFPNEKYYKIMQNFHFYPFILIPKWTICRLKISQNGTSSGTKGTISKTP